MRLTSCLLTVDLDFVLLTYSSWKITPQALPHMHTVQTEWPWRRVQEDVFELPCYGDMVHYREANRCPSSSHSSPVIVYVQGEKETSALHRYQYWTESDSGRDDHLYRELQSYLLDGQDSLWKQCSVRLADATFCNESPDVEATSHLYWWFAYPTREARTSSWHTTSSWLSNVQSYLGIEPSWELGISCWNRLLILALSNAFTHQFLSFT